MKRRRAGAISGAIGDCRPSFYLNIKVYLHRTSDEDIETGGGE